MSEPNARRQCLLFEAGPVRYAVEATSVAEVTTPSADLDTLRGVLPLTSLSTLFGDKEEERPGMAVVLDVSPTLALRVRKIHGVAELAGCPVFRLPRGLPPWLSKAVRGAVLHEGRVFLELVPEGLLALEAKLEPPRQLGLLIEPPERAMLFESQGRLWGLPLGWVSQVVTSSDAFCACPAPHGPVVGLFPYQKELWPIFSAPALMGQPAAREEFFVLFEVAGQQAGLSAARVLGVFQDLSRGDRQGEFVARKLGTSALFLDLQGMFS